MGEWSPWHWAIVAVVLVVLFGSKRLPDAARSLGRSLRIFKTEMKALHDDDPQPAAVIGDASGDAAPRTAPPASVEPVAGSSLHTSA